MKAATGKLARPLEFVNAARCEERHLSSCCFPRPVSDEPLGVDSQSLFTRLKEYAVKPTITSFPTMLAMTDRAVEDDDEDVAAKEEELSFWR